MLSVPAHGNAVKASPGFQLFATQRYIHNDVRVNSFKTNTVIRQTSAEDREDCLAGPS